ncbi:hypothetical protein [Paenibacillus sp. FSL P4-0288]|uniref:hypothetical protein n=1 Tax=Paenibacillus sp. FSL P4-0288 TaxID=2921633 RepID=UPI0030FC34C5
MSIQEVHFEEGILDEAKEVIQRYHLTGELNGFEIIEANSAHGWVYRIIGFPYVIKIYKPEGKHNQDHFTLSQLQHCPYTPRLFAYVDNKFVVMEYIEGLTIQEYLKEFKALPAQFYDQLRLALYEITYTANIVLQDMKVDSSVLIHRTTSHIHLLDFGVVDFTRNLPDAVAIDWAHRAFMSFLTSMGDNQLFRNMPAAERTFQEALITNKDKDVDYFLKTECSDIVNILKDRKETETKRRSGY